LGRVLAGKIDAFFKGSVAVSFLLAAGSVAYYFAVYLPGRDARLDHEQKVDAAKAEYARRADEQARRAAQQAQEEQRAAEQDVQEQRRASEKQAARDRYQRCVRSAEYTYSSNWANNCKRLAEDQIKKRADCLRTETVGKSSCEVIYATRDGSPNCTLPRVIAADLDADHDKAKDRCLRESQLNLQ
jgi:hypothetical protein